MRRRVLLNNNMLPVDANGHEYVDLGLPSGLLWATCNIGASKPEEYGLYFAWGETQGYANATDKINGFNWTTAPYWKSGTSATSTKWSKYTDTDGYSSDGKADNKLILEPEDDAAHVNMGGDWRMPTRDEFQELIDKCSRKWTKVNGINGWEFTNNGNSVFFPAAGEATGASMGSVGLSGDYWSSSLAISYSCYAYYLSFSSMEVIHRAYGFRYEGKSVRGVLDSK